MFGDDGGVFFDVGVDVGAELLLLLMHRYLESPACLDEKRSFGQSK